MTIFTGATLAALITSNDCVSPAVAPVKVGISHHESALNALAIHDNVTERRYAPMSTAKAVRTASSLLGLRHSVDAGIAQVNSKNRPWISFIIARGHHRPLLHLHLDRRLHLARVGQAGRSNSRMRTADPWLGQPRGR